MSNYLIHQVRRWLKRNMDHKSKKDKSSLTNAEDTDRIELLPAQTRETSGFEFQVGDQVEKHTGDYKLAGVVVAAFHTVDGKERYVVEHQPLAPGLLHIYGPTNLRKL